jgi:hypothetical protein
MATIPPIPIFGGDHAEVDLIHQLGGFEGVAFPLALHEVAGEAAQLGEDEAEELVFGVAAALAPFLEELGDIACRFHCYTSIRSGVGILYLNMPKGGGA